MVVFDHGWWWFIPFSDGTWSVGVVTDAMLPGATLDERFDRLVESTATVRERLKDATRLMPVRRVGLLLRVRQIVDDGYVAIGDAAGFLDPIFSSGVFLAMATAEKVAEVLTPSWRGRARCGLRTWPGTSGSRGKDSKRFREFVVGFYDPDSRHLLRTRRSALYSSVTSILAGAVFAPSSGLRWWSNVVLFFGRLESRKQRRAAAKG
jgi:flavin-dependent dehydrogenase